ncbi:MAG: hypothetical protein IIB22_03910 [Chloroflexi bacterium]|nr:hypothetical protein [Chloroflexota bacterium]
MIELKIQFRDKREPEHVLCDRYEIEDKNQSHLTKKWLMIYRGDGVVGTYDMEDVIGFQELPPRQAQPPEGRPWLR